MHNYILCCSLVVAYVAQLSIEKRMRQTRWDTMVDHQSRTCPEDTSDIAVITIGLGMQSWMQSGSEWYAIDKIDSSQIVNIADM